MSPRLVPSLNLSSTARWWAAVWLALLALELGSWFGWHYPALGSLLAVALTLVWLLVVRSNLALGIALLGAELILGSQGYWYKLVLGNTVLSLRYLMFMAAAGYLLWLWRQRRSLAIMSSSLKWWYLAALLSLGWAVAVGFSRGNNFSNLFLDVNGYLYLLLFPLWFEVRREPKALAVFKQVLLPVLVWLAFKTLLALYLFSHFMPEQLLPFYQWWRQTGFGEITFVSGSLYRIFAQSQVFAVVAAGLGWAWLWHKLARHELKQSWPGLTLLWFMLITTVTSLSRSFWLGLAVAWVVVACGRAFKLSTFLAYVAVSGCLVLASAGAVLAITHLAWPLPPIGLSSAETLAKRLGSEAASQSRLQLLPPLGQAVARAPLTGAGFGATVTYVSVDPRLVKATAGGSGLVTTYAFEWGYLDLWLKLGLIGFVLYLSFLCQGMAAQLLAWFKTRAPDSVAAFGLITLLGLNLTTPYLNHPLGLGLIMLSLSLAVTARPAYAS